ncbi:hypothetical protein SAMN04487847_0678 [Microbacterium sp. cf332]|nr:hypothetical protein SAMN04487847_0678 [Microbacterium sp. cf332]
MCYKCREWTMRGGEAARVLPLAYAIYNTQFRLELRAYKDAARPSGQTPALRNLQALMWSFSYHHSECLSAVSQSEPTAVAVVPSGHPREGSHPFERVAQFAPASWERVETERRYEIGRECDPDSVGFVNVGSLEGRHLVVLDDAWTTGSKAEGVVMAARREGASEVTVIPVGRIVNTSYSAAVSLLQFLSERAWSVDVCPVTGADCPA